jgi:uncharacterized membrane protein
MGQNRDRHGNGAEGVAIVGMGQAKIGELLAQTVKIEVGGDLALRFGHGVPLKQIEPSIAAVTLILAWRK